MRLGAVARDRFRFVLLSASKNIGMKISVEAVEALAARFGLQIASEVGSH